MTKSGKSGQVISGRSAVAGKALSQEGTKRADDALRSRSSEVLSSQKGKNNISKEYNEYSRRQVKHEPSSDEGSDKEDIWYADCTGCGKTGEYKVTRYATGGNRYKRHSVTVNRITTYCGVFRHNARKAANVNEDDIVSVKDDSPTNSKRQCSSQSEDVSCDQSVDDVMYPPSKKARAYAWIKTLSEGDTFRGAEDISSPVKCNVCDKHCKNKQVLAMHHRRIHCHNKSAPGTLTGDFFDKNATFNSDGNRTELEEEDKSAIGSSKNFEEAELVTDNKITSMALTANTEKDKAENYFGQAVDSGELKADVEHSLNNSLSPLEKYSSEKRYRNVDDEE